MWRGAPHTAKRLSVVPLGAPLPTYIKEGGRRRPARRRRAQWGESYSK